MPLRLLPAGPPPPATLLSIVVPVYNEERNVREIVSRLVAVPWPLPVELIFVDDGSRDRSPEILDELRQAHGNLRLHRFERNRGKSAALVAGIELARGQIITVQDADLEYDPRDLPALVELVLHDRADVVYGSRFRRESLQVHRTFHMLVNRALTLFSNLCSGIFVTDMETCYKVFRADVLRAFRFRTKRFGFEPEVTAYLGKFRLRILELPISYFPRNRTEGKKIGWRDGVAALWFIVYFNFFVSAKRCLRQSTATAAAGRLEDRQRDERSAR